MFTIYKYQIAPSLEPTKLGIPGGGSVLSADLDARGDICVWALVNPEEREVPVNIYCIGTGWPLKQKDNLIFIGTVKRGPYIWHVFKEEEDND